MKEIKSEDTSEATAQKTAIRDRVVERIRVRAGDLRPNPSNWRRHPARQRKALQWMLEEVGYADALLARREGEELVLIDGHLRRSLDPDQVVPVLVVDVDEQEADLLSCGRASRRGNHRAWGRAGEAPSGPWDR